MFSIAIPGYCAYNLCKNYGRAGINRCAPQQGGHHDQPIEGRGSVYARSSGVLMVSLLLFSLLMLVGKVNWEYANMQGLIWDNANFF